MPSVPGLGLAVIGVEFGRFEDAEIPSGDLTTALGLACPDQTIAG
jgi:hypothetical protein